MTAMINTTQSAQFDMLRRVSAGEVAYTKGLVASWVWMNGGTLPENMIELLDRLLRQKLIMINTVTRMARANHPVGLTLNGVDTLLSSRE
jgi:hypothetical protein